MNRILKKTIMIIVIVIAALALIAGAVFGYYKLFIDPNRGTVEEYEQSLPLSSILTKEQAEQDLDYLISHLRDYHPAWLDETNDLATRDEVEAQYATEKANLKDNITVLEFLRAACRVTNKLHDGHTMPWIVCDAKHYISDFTEIYKYNAPVKINGISSETFIQEMLNSYSYETEEFARAMFGQTMVVCMENLEFLGVDVSDGVTFTYKTDDGEKDFHYDFCEFEDVKGVIEPDSSDFVYYTIDEEKSLGVFTLRECTNDEHYRAVLDEFFTEIFAKDIKNIAVDLRGNGGGDSTVANEFLTYVDVDRYDSWDCDTRMGWLLMKYRDNFRINEKKPQVFGGQLYVLTNVRTYSSAMDFAMLVTDNHLGTIVGEASGNLPSAYGDYRDFQLPNSKLSLAVSHKKWYRVDRSKDDSLIIPDYITDPQNALEKVYELIND